MTDQSSKISSDTVKTESQQDLLQFLADEGVDRAMLDEVRAFRERFPVQDPALAHRIPVPDCFYYGKDVWEEALAAILAGKNLLLSGPKATGKNVLADCLCSLFARPSWNISFHIGTDAAWLIGADSFDGERVVFRPGPVWLCANHGGFGILDEVNMAKNESLAVLHSALDHRRMIDVPGYEKIDVHPAARFIGTMNYGYAGTRELNEALSSRFTILNMPPIAEADLDRLIARRFPALREKIREQFVKLFLEIEKKAESSEISGRALDLRGILDAISLAQQGLPAGKAVEMCVVNKVFDAYERTLVRDTVQARIPAELGRAEMFGDGRP